MRIIIIGAVAAGTSAAAKARRNDEDAEIVVYEKDGFISYSSCGMPYYLGGTVPDAAQLTPRDEAFFKAKYRVDMLTRHEVIAILSDQKMVTVRNLRTGETFEDRYDRLVVATGTNAVTPRVPGFDGKQVFVLHNINDMLRIHAFIESHHPGTAVIIGAGYIGLEMCENLKKLGIAVTIVEKMPQVAPGMDEDMAAHIRNHLEEKGVTVYTAASVAEINAAGVILADGREIPAELVLVSVGVRPNTKLAQKAGVELGVTGAIRVDNRMHTSLPDVYACGDCIEQFQVVTGRPIWRPLGSTANKTGRIAGDCVTGGELSFRGVLGTGIARVFDLTLAQTGLTEREARREGYDVAVCHNTKPNKPTYMQGREMTIKAVADRATGRLLGAQIVGYEGVDKRIDVLATAITFKAMAQDLFHLDLAYAPPFSTTKDPVNYTGMILDNMINRGRPLMTGEQLDALIASGKKYSLIDTRKPESYEESHIKTAVSIPHEKIREVSEKMDQNEAVITYCNKGTTGNAAQNILLNKGFPEVYNLSGGKKQYQSTHRKDSEK